MQVVITTRAYSGTDAGMQGDEADRTAMFWVTATHGREIRGISQAEARVKEAVKLGFERCVLPSSNSVQLKHLEYPHLLGVGSLGECWKLLF